MRNYRFLVHSLEEDGVSYSRIDGLVDEDLYINTVHTFVNSVFDAVRSSIGYSDSCYKIAGNL